MKTNRDTQGRLDKAAMNTDVEIWRKPGAPESMMYYQPSISITKQNLVQIHVGGHVIGMPIEEWHKLAVGNNLATNSPDKQTEDTPSRQELPQEIDRILAEQREKLKSIRREKR